MCFFPCTIGKDLLLVEAWICYCERHNRAFRKRKESCFFRERHGFADSHLSRKREKVFFSFHERHGLLVKPSQKRGEMCSIFFLPQDTRLCLSQKNVFSFFFHEKYRFVSVRGTTVPLRKNVFFSST